MVIGGPGSGKSTLARNLGQVTGLPVHHMDRIHWMPGWVERTKADKVPLARAIEAQEAWIFEGGLSATFAERAARADRIIWLDLPSPVRLWRVIKRIAGGYGRTRPDLPADCPERIDLAFLAPDSRRQRALDRKARLRRRRIGRREREAVAETAGQPGQRAGNHGDPRAPQQPRPGASEPLSDPLLRRHDCQATQRPCLAGIETDMIHRPTGRDRPMRATTVAAVRRRAGSVRVVFTSVLPAPRGYARAAGRSYRLCPGASAPVVGCCMVVTRRPRRSHQLPLVAEGRKLLHQR